MPCLPYRSTTTSPRADPRVYSERQWRRLRRGLDYIGSQDRLLCTGNNPSPKYEYCLQLHHLHHRPQCHIVNIIDPFSSSFHCRQTPSIRSCASAAAAYSKPVLYALSTHHHPPSKWRRGTKSTEVLMLDSLNPLTHSSLSFPVYYIPYYSPNPVTQYSSSAAVSWWSRYHNGKVIKFEYHFHTSSDILYTIFVTDIGDWCELIRGRHKETQKVNGYVKRGGWWMEDMWMWVLLRL